MRPKEKRRLLNDYYDEPQASDLAKQRRSNVCYLFLLHNRFKAGSRKHKIMAIEKSTPIRISNSRKAPDSSAKPLTVTHASTATMHREIQSQRVNFGVRARSISSMSFTTICFNNPEDSQTSQNDNDTAYTSNTPSNWRW